MLHAPTIGKPSLWACKATPTPEVAEGVHPGGAPAAVEQPGAQTIEQSVLNHVADERANSVAAPAPAFINPNADDKVGTRNQVDTPLLVDPDAAQAGARGRIVNVPQ